MKVTQDGKEYEFMGYSRPRLGDYYLSKDENILLRATVNHPQERAIFRPVPVEHCFGNVIFQETGEERAPTYGDWWVDTSYDGYGPLLRLYRAGCGHLTKVRIVKPVRILP